MGIDAILFGLVLLVGFYMAWNIGANDVSNAMGTSVGSGALTLRRAIYVAAILEFAGAFLLGNNVSETMQSGLINPEHFAAAPKILLYGMFSALLGTSIWLQVASYFGWPVSTTHAIVGSIIGFGAIYGGASTVHWEVVGSVALSWVISPALSGVFAYLIFTTLQRKILYALCPIDATKKLLPVLTAILFTTFSLSTLFGGLHNIHIKLTTVQSILISVGVGCLAYLIAYIAVRKVNTPEGGSDRPAPYDLLQITSLEKSLKHLQRLKLSSEGDRKDEVSRILKDVRGLSEKVKIESGIEKRQSDYQVVERLFGFLQILSACYVAFAHGANDVANAIGPVAAALEIITSGTVNSTGSIPPWLLAMGGLGIVIGLATWGWRVIQTVGKKITELTPTRGFSAEFGAAATILIASKLGLPVSTTHCVVGAVLGVGLARGLSALNLKTLREIVLSWVVTIPSSALVTVLIFYLIRLIFV